MLKPIDKSEIPGYRGKGNTALRRFADETAAEFVATSKLGDFAEVTEAPLKMDAKGVQKLAQNLRDALFAMEPDKDMRKEVRVITRGGSRVFLERTESFEQRKARLEREGRWK